MNEKIMTWNQFTTELKARKRNVLLAILLITSLVFAIAAILPAKYQSDVSLIVIQKQSSDKVDAFSATKSAEYLSNILTRVIYTNTFFKDVMDSPYEIANTFPHDPEELKIAWEKEVATQKINNTGIIKITVFDTNREQAETIAQGIAWNLSQNGQKYHGGGDMVEVELIDGPITSSRQTQPNVWGLTLIGFMISLIGSLASVYFFPKIYRDQESAVTSEEMPIIDQRLDKEEERVYSNISTGKILSQVNEPQGTQADKKMKALLEK